MRLTNGWDTNIVLGVPPPLIVELLDWCATTKVVETWHNRGYRAYQNCINILGVYQMHPSKKTEEIK